MKSDNNRMKKHKENVINYYELLEVSPTAGSGDIKRAYYDKLKIWHPDKNADRMEEAEDVTKTLNQAYSVLSDPEQRKQYDRILRYTKGRD